jgi:hypothetical protein
MQVHDKRQLTLRPVIRDRALGELFPLNPGG